MRVFEALHELGGVLVYGIPEFRLPKSIVKGEVDNLRRMGVEFETNVVVGKSVTIDELMHDEDYDAVFVATGAGLPVFLGVPGEHFNGVYSANEFLTRVNLMRAYQFPEYDEPVYDCRDRDVIVVGGGNTAMDAVRTARRLGARIGHAGLSPLRSGDAGPRRRSEARPPGRHRVPHADQSGRVPRRRKGLADRRALRAHGAGRAGRERPPPAGGRSPARSSCCPRNVVIIGVGTTANPLIQSTTPDLKTNKRNYIVADPETMRTSKRGVFAGGDIVTGGATVILAMGAGRKAAASIHEYLTTRSW